MRWFLKGGIYNKLDRSEDHSINIGGLEDCEIPEFYLQSDGESDGSCAKSEMSYNEGNGNENSSSENSSTDPSLKDSSNIADYLIIFSDDVLSLKVSCHL